ncbi:MAG: hypothetical protein A2X22_02635 [Bacteroidetes bacterium GWF2_49_14]|nr:MAG: hypothetical protein A2X22_02635 [Bacteroidetes bacterium GWF2_49_14]HBB91325.1 alpha/beta hydrolase [Bacteroidales bacterium]
MKKFLLILVAFFAVAALSGQDITGTWNGVLKVQGIQLRLVFHVTKTDTGFSSTMDSPDQGAAGIPMTSTVYENNLLTLKHDAATIVYTGELKDGIIAGTFKQGGQSFPMDLKREAAEKVTVKRPQEPVQPYPYLAEEVVFENAAANARLAGTLTLPKSGGPFTVAVLISGSGPQNRDEELLGHKPFLVLSDYLTRNGIAVLRYDDRGTASSTGNFSLATTEDLATDAEAAIAYLKTRKEINPEKIGLIGHSEGGMIAPLVASRSKDVAFIVMMAGTGMRGSSLLPLQSELISKAAGIPEADLAKGKEINARLFDMVAKSKDPEKLQLQVTTYLNSVVKDLPANEKPQGMSDEDLVKTQVNQLCSPWMLFFLNYNPIPALKKVKCPVLAINGEKDLQVPPKENLGPIKKALKKNKSVTIIEFPGMNHLFQECTTGSPNEYAQIEETLSPKMLKVVGDWVGNR